MALMKNGKGAGKAAGNNGDEDLTIIISVIIMYAYIIGGRFYEENPNLFGR